MLVGVGGVEVVGNIVLQFTPPRTTPLGRAREAAQVRARLQGAAVGVSAALGKGLWLFAGFDRRKEILVDLLL